MPKRPKKADPAAAAVDSDASKKPKPREHVIKVKVYWPPDVSERTATLSTGNESKRAARTAEAAATGTMHFRNNADYPRFVGPFEAAVASALASARAEKRGPVSLNDVTTAMMKVTNSKLKFEGKRLKNIFAWRGFKEGRWQITRDVPGQGQVAFPRGSPMDKNPPKWKFLSA